MSRNIAVLLVVSLFFGLAFGVYEIVLPLYLRDRQHSYWVIALIFAAAEIAVFFLRVYVGRLSDMLGRKIFYSLSLVLCAIANGLVPLSSAALFQLPLKALRESTVFVRNTMHSLLIYDQARDRFMELLGKTRGGEFVFQGLGAFAVIFLMSSERDVNYVPPFLFTAVLLGAGWVFFSVAYKERTWKAPASAPAGSVFSLHMPRGLALLTLYGFIFEMAITLSHSFAIPIFFRDKFSASWTQIGVINAVHRLTMGIPLLIIGPLLRRRLKMLFIVFVIVEGVLLAVSALIPNFTAATCVWLLHDLVGAGVWFPIYGQFVQQYSRPECRGEDVAKAGSLSQLGRIFGPLLCGAVMGLFSSPGLKVSSAFVASGLLLIIAPLPLIWLREHKSGTPQAS